MLLQPFASPAPATGIDTPVDIPVAGQLVQPLKAL
jgi:hypothetical protein